jgi:phenylpyruvate tautomerase PptA (4-oxalocrotonate tautomerase family)
MVEKMQEIEALKALIMKFIKKDPARVGIIIQIINEAVWISFEENKKQLKEEISETKEALLSALALIKNKKIKEEIKEYYLEKIKKSLKNPNSYLEREFIEENNL